jgi:hypothetical protein
LVLETRSESLVCLDFVGDQVKEYVRYLGAGHQVRVFMDWYWRPGQRVHRLVLETRSESLYVDWCWRPGQRVIRLVMETRGQGVYRLVPETRSGSL